MSRYLFIQSQDPFTEARTAAQFDLAQRLAGAGHSVRLLLVQNAVFAARSGAQCPGFDALLGKNITVYADTFSLQQREIAPDQLKPGIGQAGPHEVIDAMLDGEKVIWH